MNLALILLFIIPLASASGQWGYHGSGTVLPDKWYTIPGDEICGDGTSKTSHQSPVDVVGPFTLTLESWVLYDYDYGWANLTIVNNGHTVMIDASNAISQTSSPDHPRIKSTKSNEYYNLAQIHFHWGPDSKSGSEHQLQGSQKALEMHAVHYNTKYTNISVAMKQKDGLAVIGVLFNESPQSNRPLSPFFDVVGNVPHADDKYVLPNIDVSQLISLNQYHYTGSLTTPGCFETVQWIVIEDVDVVSTNQMAKLRGLFSHGTDAIAPNYRPVQALNGRTIYASPNFVWTVHWAVYLTLSIIAVFGA